MLKFFFVLLCILTSELNCQVLKPDSAYSKNDSVSNFFYNPSINYDLNSYPEEGFQIDKITTLNHLYFLSHDSLFSNLFYYNYQAKPLPHANIFHDSQNLYSNTLEMKNYFHNFYLQTRLSTFQKILYDIDFSGAVILAGYHVWKYYIKPKSK